MRIIKAPTIFTNRQTVCGRWTQMRGQGADKWGQSPFVRITVPCATFPLRNKGDSPFVHVSLRSHAKETVPCCPSLVLCATLAPCCIINALKLDWRTCTLNELVAT